ncbi:hypothetical protein P5Z58_04035, partial [Limosilactobacillus mucosae]|nr:hypothetical protein [Limosilactobacillus mucosae]
LLRRNLYRHPAWRQPLLPDQPQHQQTALLQRLWQNSAQRHRQLARPRHLAKQLHPVPDRQVRCRQPVDQQPIVKRLPHPRMEPRVS